MHALFYRVHNLEWTTFLVQKTNERTRRTHQAISRYPECRWKTSPLPFRDWYHHSASSRCHCYAGEQQIGLLFLRSNNEHTFAKPKLKLIALAWPICKIPFGSGGNRVITFNRWLGQFSSSSSFGSYLSSGLFQMFTHQIHRFGCHHITLGLVILTWEKMRTWRRSTLPTIHTWLVKIQGFTSQVSKWANLSVVLNWRTRTECKQQEWISRSAYHRYWQEQIPSVSRQMEWQSKSGF